MATNIISVQDGPRLTVSMIVKAPTLIPRRILDMMDQEFLVDSVLRKGSDAPSGAVIYFESTPLFSNDDPGVLEEFGEIPVTTGALGTPKVVRTVRRSFGLRISKTMQDRNSIDAVNTQIVQIRNTMIRAWEDAFFSALVSNPNVQFVTTDTSWSDSASHIRADVNAARYVVKNAAADTAGKQKFGFVPDTLIISTETEVDFLDSDEVSKPYIGNIADENLQYTGKLPQQFLGLDVVTSWRLSAYAPSSAVVVQRNVVGGISDERPLSATALYGEGNGPNGGPTESWRSDTTRQSAIFIDQPLACCFIVGVNGNVDASFGGQTIDLTSVTGESADLTTPSTASSPDDTLGS